MVTLNPGSREDVDRRTGFVHFATVVSLLLLPTFLVAWLRSYAHESVIHLRRGPHHVCFVSARGRVTVGHADAPGLEGTPTAQLVWMPVAPTPAPGTNWTLAGFGRGTGALGREVPTLSRLPLVGTMFTPTVPARFAWLPWWALALVTAVMPAVRLGAERRRRARRRTGRCVDCGYDLRASPGRCPECGAAASVAIPG